MKIPVFLLTAFLATACATDPPPAPLAMEPPAPDTVETPPWAERAPTTADIMQVYPYRALRAEVTSRVKLTCTVMSDWSLACGSDYVEEAPGYGFGEAALTVSKLFLVKQDNTLGLAPGVRVIVPVRFALAG